MSLKGLKKGWVPGVINFVIFYGFVEIFKTDRKARFSSRVLKEKWTPWDFISIVFDSPKEFVYNRMHYSFYFDKRETRF